jgi:hypothetical protein
VPTGASEKESFVRRLKNDMEVTGAEVNHLGHIAQVRPKDFLLHRPLTVAIFVPFTAIERVSEADTGSFLMCRKGRLQRKTGRAPTQMLPRRSRCEHTKFR